MSRAADFERVIADPSQRLEGSEPIDALIIELILAVVSADGQLQPEEEDLLRRCLPEPETLMARLAAGTLELEDLADRFENADEALIALRIAALVAWADRFLDTQEKVSLVRFAAAAGLPRDAVETTFASIIGAPMHGVTADHVRAALDMEWLDLTFVERSPQHFDQGEALGTVLLDDTELAGIYGNGLAFTCTEGSVWLPWDAFAQYTRVPTFGTGLRIVSRDGDVFRVADPRARGLSTFLDRVFSQV